MKWHVFETQCVQQEAQLENRDQRVYSNAFLVALGVIIHIP